MKARDWGALFSGLCLVASQVDSDYSHPFVVIMMCCIAFGMLVHFRKRSVYVCTSVRGCAMNTTDSMVLPDGVLGVEVSTLSSPVFLSGVQRQVKGDGNCFWRSCAALYSPWKQLKRSVVGGYHCMSGTFTPFRRACIRRPDF
eukprot:3404750-Amphidinium_carterae.1